MDQSVAATPIQSRRMRGERMFGFCFTQRYYYVQIKYFFCGMILVWLRLFILVQYIIISIYVQQLI
jgi:hypothetical protein